MSLITAVVITQLIHTRMFSLCSFFLLTLISVGWGCISGKEKSGQIDITILAPKRQSPGIPWDVYVMWIIIYILFSLFKLDLK